jgi:hypothetical protein
VCDTFCITGNGDNLKSHNNENRHNKPLDDLYNQGDTIL